MHSCLQRFGHVILLTVAVFSVTGCSYVCHNYQPFTAEIDKGAWRIDGEVGRRQREDAPPAPGSVYHWRPDAQDRWWVELTPIARDTSFWHTGDVELADLRVVAGVDTIRPAWNVKIDLVLKAGEYTYADGSHRIHRLEFGKYRFESVFFHLPKKAPSVLKIRCRMILCDAETGEARSQYPLELLAVLNRHRRWTIVDAAEL